MSRLPNSRRDSDLRSSSPLKRDLLTYGFTVMEALGRRTDPGATTMWTPNSTSFSMLFTASSSLAVKESPAKACNLHNVLFLFPGPGRHSAAAQNPEERRGRWGRFWLQAAQDSSGFTSPSGCWKLATKWWAWITSTTTTTSV